VKATANHIHEHGGEFVLPVKENRQALFDALDALPWGQVPIARTATDKGHGRITTRTIQVLPAPDNLPFPHVSQVFLIERHVADLAGKPVSDAAALGVASPEPGQADPVALAGYVREQWSIESLHWIRETLYQEDKSQVRTRSGPRIMASLRNLAIGALRLAGRTDVTDATAGPDAPWTGPSPSSDSHHDLGTAVVRTPDRSAPALPRPPRDCRPSGGAAGLRFARTARLRLQRRSEGQSLQPPLHRPSRPGHP
jgi:hypothetical protein